MKSPNRVRSNGDSIFKRLMIAIGRDDLATDAELAALGMAVNAGVLAALGNPVPGPFTPSPETAAAVDAALEAIERFVPGSLQPVRPVGRQALDGGHPGRAHRADRHHAAEIGRAHV